MEFDVEGLHCASCVSRLEDALRALPGVERAEVNLASNTARVDIDPKETEVVLASFKQLPYKLTAKKQKRHQGNPYRAVFALLLTIPLHFHLQPLWQGMLAAFVQFILGYSIYRGAFRALRAFFADMDVLVALGTTSAFLLSLYNAYRGQPLYFEGGASIISFVLLGRYLEERAKMQSRGAVEKLLDLQAKTALRLEGGKFVQRSVDELKPGDILRLRQGERIPVDGVLKEGYAYIDESLLSGEAEACPKAAGDSIYAGCLNAGPVFLMESRALGESTRLAALARLVEKAQNSKAPIQRMVDRIAAVFVPFVLLVSLLTFVDRKSVV